MLRIILFIFIGTTAIHLSAQTGIITIHDNAGANALVEKHIYFNKEHSQLPGWRIQIFSSTSMAESKNAKSVFLQRFDDMSASIIFESPNYKVRVGNYNNRFDANRDLQEISINYPDAFICKDLININEQ